jgi:hypothetical protein
VVEYTAPTAKAIAQPTRPAITFETEHAPDALLEGGEEPLRLM